MKVAQAINDSGFLEQRETFQRAGCAKVWVSLNLCCLPLPINLGDGRRISDRQIRFKRDDGHDDRAGENEEDISKRGMTWMTRSIVALSAHGAFWGKR